MAIYPILNKNNGEIIKVKIKLLDEVARLYVLRDEDWKDDKTFFGWRTLINDGPANVVMADDGTVFGIYKYTPCDGHLLIDCIESVKRKQYKYIGLAMLANAISMSVRLGHNGRIKLKSIVPRDCKNNPDEFYRRLGMEEEMPVSALNNYNSDEVSAVPKTWYFDEDGARKYLKKYREFCPVMGAGIKWSEFSEGYEKLERKK